MNRPPPKAETALREARRAAPSTAVRGCVHAAGAFAAAGGIATLAGWIWDVPWLMDWNSSGISMKPNAGLCAVMLGVALILTQYANRRQGLVRIPALIVVLIAGLTLLEHLGGWNLGIDTALFDEAAGALATVSPGRMGPPASMSFTLLGIALVLHTGGARARRWASGLAIAVASIVTLSLVGYLYGADKLYTVPRLTAIAFQTATMLAALAAGVIISASEHGLPFALSRDDVGGAALRRLLVPVVVLPVVLGVLLSRGAEIDLYDTRFGMALLALLMIAALLGLVAWTASGLSREARIAARELEATRRLHELGVRCADARADFQECLDHILQTALALTGARKGNVQLLKREGVLKIVAHHGFEPAFLEFFAEVGGEHAAACSAAMQARGRVIIEDVTRSEVFAGQDSLQVLLDAGVRAVQSLPLISREGRVLGMISTHFAHPHRSTEPELRRMDLLVRVAGDFIERTQAEATLKATAEALAAASRAKDEFLATLSHELRTPLSPVLFLATELEQDPSLSREAREDAASIRRHVQLEARLIDDLLDFTRIVHGKLEIQPVAADVHVLLDQTHEFLGEEMREKGIQPRFRLEAREHHVMADPVRLQQVFWNLLRNAVKFSDPGGRIEVCTANVAPGRIAIAVADTGMGISAEALPRLFRAFEQGDLHGRKNFGGLGLGLAISKSIIALHQGELRAESDGAGKGATFTVELAVAAAPPGGASGRNDAEPKRDGMCLLVVEDHAPTRAGLQRLLARDGHRVFPAGTIAEALAIAATERCDAVITDLGLPDGTGLELMHTIRTQHGWPGIVISGYGMEEDIRKSVEAGAAVHLIKPVTRAQIRRALAMIGGAQN